MSRYAILAVEGPHDQAFVARTFKQFFGFREFGGEENQLDGFWKQFIPTYPVGGRLYVRMNMPTIVWSDELSVAICAGTGNNLRSEFPLLLKNHPPYFKSICAFGIVADADRNGVERVVQQYQPVFVRFFPNFPLRPSVVGGVVRAGIFVLPDNANKGVLETLMIRCGETAYPKHIAEACEFVGKFNEDETVHWESFDREKALVASVVSILKPGKTNTVSYKDNDWVCPATLPLLQDFVDFLKSLLELP